MRDGPPVLLSPGQGGYRDLERGSRNTWAGMMRQEAGNAETLSRLDEIRTSTLVLHGGAEFPEQAEALAARIPNARFVVLPGVGHLPWVEHPEAASGAILSFLTAVGDPVPAG